MKIQFYFGAIFSNIVLFFYFLPWIYTVADIRIVLVHYLALLWFGIAWMIMLTHIGFCIFNKKANDPDWKHHLGAFVLFGLSYIGLFIGYCNGYVGMW